KNQNARSRRELGKKGTSVHEIFDFGFWIKARGRPDCGFLISDEAPRMAAPLQSFSRRCREASDSTTEDKSRPVNPKSKIRSLRFNPSVFNNHVGDIVFDGIDAPALGALQALSIRGKLNGRLTCRANQNVQQFLR